MTFEFKKLTGDEPIIEKVNQEPTKKASMIGGETPIKEIVKQPIKITKKKRIPPISGTKDGTDLSRLRQGRERHEGFDVGQYVQSVPMLFSRDGHNQWLGDQFRGGHAFLLLGGPSFGDLMKETYEFKGKKRSVKEILDYPGHVTMCVNNAVKSYRPNMWVCVDSPDHFIKSTWLDPKIQKFVPFCHTEKTIFDNESWKETNTKVGDCPNVLFYRRNEHFQHEQFMHEDTFNWGSHKKYGGSRSVMLVAFRLLYHLGIRNLYLLGCDFNMSEDSKYHFDQDRTRGSQTGNNSTYKALIERFSLMKPDLDALGYNVWNCNPDSQLKVFPHMKFIDAANRACANMPNIETERTAGLYDRQANMKKDKEVDLKKNAAKNIADQYSETDRKEIKDKLDTARIKLSNLKKLAEQEPTDENNKAVRRARTEFRKIEKEKNKIWGIVK